MARGVPLSGRLAGTWSHEESEVGGTVLGFERVEGWICVREWCGKDFDLRFGSGCGGGACGIGVERTARGILV